MGVVGTEFRKRTFYVLRRLLSFPFPCGGLLHTEAEMDDSACSCACTFFIASFYRFGVFINCCIMGYNRKDHGAQYNHSLEIFSRNPSYPCVPYFLLSLLPEPVS